jgi:hypothetical protein
VVYTSGNRPLCVFASLGPAACLDQKDTLLPSVNNSGEVLAGVPTAQECFYKAPYNFSPRPFAGASDEKRDACLAIGYWRPGLGSMVLLEPIGRDPQWISQATAELVRTWAARAALGARAGVH